jgi:hypothetical protein
LSHREYRPVCISQPGDTGQFGGAARQTLMSPNIFNNVAGTAIDFPKAPALSA